MQYAIINNGVVENIILAGPDFIESTSGDHDHIEPLNTAHEQGLGVCAGWAWDGEFHPPEMSAPVAPPTPAETRRITPLAFRRRFTKAERAAVEWAAVDKPDRPEAERQMAAALRADLRDQEQAKFIELDDLDLIEGMATLEVYGLIAEGRATEILSAPVQAGDRA